MFFFLVVHVRAHFIVRDLFCHTHACQILFYKKKEIKKNYQIYWDIDSLEKHKRKIRDKMPVTPDLQHITDKVKENKTVPRMTINNIPLYLTERVIE